MRKQIWKILSVIFAILLMLTVFSVCKKDKETQSDDESEATGTVVGSETLSKSEVIDQVNDALSKLEQTLPGDSVETPSLDWLSALRDLSFSVGDFSDASGVDSDDYLIFQDQTFYSRETEDSDSGTQSVSSDILKLYPSGILVMGTENGETTVSMTPFQASLGDVSGTVSNSDLKALLASLTMSEGDLIETDTEGQFEISAKYMLKIAKALLSLSGDDTALNDGAFDGFRFVLDMREYETEQAVSLSLTNKTTQETIDLKIDIDSIDSAHTKVTVIMNSSAFKITATIESSAESLIAIAVEIEAGGNKIHLALSAKDESSDASEAKILGAYIDFSIVGNEVNLSAEADLKIALDAASAFDTLSGSILLKQNDAKIFSAEVQCNAKALRAVGEKGLSAELEVLADGVTERLSLELETERYSESSSQYKLLVEMTEGGKVENGWATVSFPAVVEPILNETEQEYLRRSDLILENHDAYLEKANELTAQVMKQLQKGNAAHMQAKSYTKDAETGIVYFTDITVENNQYYVNTYAVPDYENHLYFYAENMADFTRFDKSLAQKDAQEVSNIIGTTLSSKMKVVSEGRYWTYTYLEDVQLYIAMKGWDANTAVFLAEEPTQEQLSGYVLHKLQVDENGVANIHDYNVRIGEDCGKIYECKTCGYSMKTVDAIHQIDEIAKKEESGELLWTYGTCSICDKKILKLHNTGNGVATVFFESFHDSMLDEMRLCDEFKGYQVADAEKAIVISEIQYDFSNHLIRPTTINIPQLSEYCGETIVGIMCGFKNIPSLEQCTLILPEGLEFIGRRTFAQDPFQSVILPESLLYIGQEVFWKSFGLEELVIPKNVKVIEHSALQDLQALRKLVVNAEYLKSFPIIWAPNMEILEINSRVDVFSGFVECKVTEFKIPEGINQLGAAFAGNSTLVKVILPSTMETIGEGAFYNCKALREVVLPSGLKTIGGEAFAYCEALEMIWVDDGIATEGTAGAFVLPEGLESLSGAFRHCLKLESSVIPKSITVVPSYLFEYCPSLKTVTLHDGITEIQHYAFHRCTSLQNIVIPASVERIGDRAFSKCESLTDSALGFGDALVSFGERAFEDCVGLENVVIPKNVTEWVGGVFDGCGLDTLRFDCVFSFEWLHVNGVAREITYANAITEQIAFGTVTNIYTTELPSGKGSGYSIPDSIEAVRFAGSEENFKNAGYRWKDGQNVEFDVVFEDAQP